jgi:hypothetical protein
MITTRGEAHVVARKGSVFVKFPNGEIKRINGVVNVLDIKWNLLSIGCIFDQGYTVKFTNSICIIRDMQAHTTFFTLVCNYHLLLITFLLGC